MGASFIDLITIKESNKFYKLAGSDIICKHCNDRIGDINKNDSSGFGVRLNINQVKKKKQFQYGLIPHHYK